MNGIRGPKDDVMQVKKEFKWRGVMRNLAEFVFALALTDVACDAGLYDATLSSSSPSVVHDARYQLWLPVIQPVVPSPRPTCTSICSSRKSSVRWPCSVSRAINWQPITPLSRHRLLTGRHPPIHVAMPLPLALTTTMAVITVSLSRLQTVIRVANWLLQKRRWMCGPLSVQTSRACH